MAQIKVTILRNGVPAPGAKLVYGDKKKIADANGVILWTGVDPDYEESISYHIKYDNGDGTWTLGSGGGGQPIEAGDDIEIGD